MSIRGVIKKFLPTRVFAKIEPYGHLAEAVVENIVYGFPMRGLKVIGVTGTAGKTTTCTLVTQMMRDSGLKVAMMSTIAIDYGDGQGPQPNSTRMTSLGSLKLLEAVKKIKASKVEWLVLETTSQALTQHRVFAVPYSIVAFTNLGHDNFHYHGTFEKYLKAKLMLFKQANRHHSGLRIGIVNSDDPNGQYFASVIKHPVTYGLKSGDLRASSIKLRPSGSTFKASINGDDYQIKSNLPGEFNVYNCLAAIGICRSVGLSKIQIEQGIEGLKSVEGRMNSVDVGQDFNVLIDYAVTPESYNQLFAAIKPIIKGRIIVVFGSAGRRDELKRPVQGEIAAKQADIVILTEEDDRDQNGLKIMEEIAAGAEKSGKKRDRDLFLIHDRTKAVERAIKLAKTGDMVLLLGKGEETVIITNKPGFKAPPHHLFNESTDTIRVPYNEKATAIAALKKLKSKD